MKTRIILGPLVLGLIALLFWGDYALVQWGADDSSLPRWLVQPWGFTLLATAALMVCAHEVMNLFGKAGLEADRASVFLGLLATIALSLDLGTSTGGSALIYAPTFFLVVLGAQSIWNPDVKSFASRFAASLASFVYVAVPAATILSLRTFGLGLHDGLWLVIFLVVTNRLGADTGAYFAGKAFGRRKLIPHVSPKKTIEGFLGGVVGAVGLAYLCLWLMPSLARNFSAQGLGSGNTDAWWITGLVGLMMGILAPVGDLVASALKRSAGEKDSGRLLPEFGGILDLIDGLLLTGPFLLLVLQLLERVRLGPV